MSPLSPKPGVETQSTAAAGTGGPGPFRQSKRPRGIRTAPVRWPPVQKVRLTNLAHLTPRLTEGCWTLSASSQESRGGFCRELETLSFREPYFSCAVQSFREKSLNQRITECFRLRAVQS